MNTGKKLKIVGYLLGICFLVWAVTSVLMKKTRVSAPPRRGPAHEVIDKKILLSADSEASLLELAKKYPDSAPVYERLGETYSKEKKWDEAIKNYERAGELGLNDPTPFNKAGEICYFRGDMQKAAECWAQSVVIAPNRAESRLNLATVYYSQGRLNEAFSQLREAMKLDPENKKAAALLKRMTRRNADEYISNSRGNTKKLP